MIENLNNVTPLKTGGQKEVYIAEHPIHGKVVYKKIKPNRDNLERTLREIRAASIIKSPFVPSIIDHNCTEYNPSFLWLLEEFINGNTLRDELVKNQKFTIKEVVH